MIKDIEIFPSELRSTIQTMSENELNTPYRAGGWRIRQVVHHLGDSHLNGYIRFKLALTENLPTIKPYDQTRWAELQDSEKFPVEDSLRFLELLHQRWIILLKSMRREEFDLQLNHPESGVLSLKIYLGAYAWHGNHHLSHITTLIAKEGW
jgi:hypothetical protein